MKKSFVFFAIFSTFIVSSAFADGQRGGGSDGPGNSTVIGGAAQAPAALLGPNATISNGQQNVVLVGPEPVLAAPQPPSAPECGTDSLIGPSQTGAPISTAQRIQDCAKRRYGDDSTRPVYASDVTWRLVARQLGPETKRFYEVWQDSKTGLLWGDNLDKQYSQETAVELSKTQCTSSSAPFNSGSIAVTITNCQVLQELACGSNDAKAADDQVSDRTFGLPTTQDWYQAELDGIRETIGLTYGAVYMTASSSLKDSSVFAYIFNNVNDHTLNASESPSSYTTSTDDIGTVRCVGR